MSIEVRITMELGDTDGSTLVRIGRTETVLKPRVKTSSADQVALARATVDRLAAEVRRDALEQVEQFLEAMRAGEIIRLKVDRVSGAFTSVDGRPLSQDMHDFLAEFPAEVRASEHFVDAVNWASTEGEAIGPAAVQIVSQVVREAERRG